MANRALSWRVEDTCINAFPCLRQVIYRDWLLRISDGFTRRANSINPRSETIDDLESGAAACARMFVAQGQRPIFRIPDICDPRLDRHLDRLGYTAEGETMTLYADLDDAAAAADPAVEILGSPSREWLGAMGGLQNRSPEQNRTFERIVHSIAVPVAFAALREEGELTALTLGAVHDGLLCFESVVTGARFRGRGHARRLLASLNHWAHAEGAEGVCLQVEASNTAGLALYDRLGLKTALYRYHYRRSPGSAD